MLRSVDVAILGAGVAGTTLAAVLQRRGLSLALIDPHATPHADFRAEKLSPSQMAAFERMGVGAAIRRCATPIPQLSIVRFGQVVETRPNAEYGIDYADLVAAARSRLESGVFRAARASAVSGTHDGTYVTLSTGERLAARLVVVATGLGQVLLGDLGIRRRSVADNHCLAVGFDLAAPEGRPIGPTTIFGHDTGERSAYLTLFPIGARTRANLFVYRRHDEAWARAFRADPRHALLRLMPELDDLVPGFDVVGPRVLRPIHLYESEGHVRDGVVLIGDAFATTCPTGGTGLEKALTDVERLARLVPVWLASPGMGASKIAQFYDDPVKRACDRNAVRMTAHARGMALGSGLVWSLRRYRNFYGQKARHWLRGRRSARPQDDVVPARGG